MYKYTLIIIILFTIRVNAQETKEKSIDVNIGYGISSSFDEVETIGSGFYLQGEYVIKLKKWIDLRPYAGFIFTKSTEIVDEPGYKSNANAFLIGGKTRIKAPIPWVSPYLEIGIGASIGNFETITFSTNIDKSGMFLHIPFSLGLELGKKHNFDLAFTYYFHNELKQFSGAAAIGFSFPLD